MVNFHNAVTFAREFGAYALSSDSGDLPSFFFNSGNRKCLAHRGWYIYVSLVSLQSRYPASRALLDYSTAAFRKSASSWEFFTTLDYEWDVIRGHRPYRWTIWVCTLLSGFINVTGTAQPQ
jgi:hypothetical protein